MRRWSNTKNYKQLGKFKKSHNAIVCCFTHRKENIHNTKIYLFVLLKKILFNGYGPIVRVLHSFLMHLKKLLKQTKRLRCTEQTFGLCGRRRGWDVSREQHRNMYIIYSETDHQPRLDA